MVADTPQKALVRRFYDEIWNRRELDHIPEILNTDVTFRGSLGPVMTGHAAFADYVKSVTGPLEGYACDILEMVEEGPRLVAKMLFHGRHTGSFMGFAPTGKRVEWHGSAHFAFRDGKIADLWVLGDVAGLRTRLEADAAEQVM